MSRIILPVALLWIIALASCSQAPVQYVHQVDTLYVSDTSGSRLTGTLHGTVSLVDYHFAPTYYLSDASGATVTVEGTSFTTTTDSNGHWAIGNLPTGTYTIAISKEGFGTYKVFGQQFVGGGEFYLGAMTVLGRIPTEFSISNLTLDSMVQYGASYTYFWLHGWTSPITLPQTITPYLFAFKDSTTATDPTMTPPLGYCSFDYNGAMRGNSNTPSVFRQLGFKSGDRAYLVVCFCFSTASGYVNPALGMSIYPAMSPVRSNFVAITIP